MSRNLNWHQILRLLEQNKSHELPLNFSLAIDNYEYHYVPTLQHMVGNAIHALRSCGWDVNTSENFASRSTSYFFNHRDPEAHARAVLRAAGHSDDTLVHHRQRVYPQFEIEDEPIPESSMLTKATSIIRELRARRGLDLDLTPGTIQWLPLPSPITQDTMDAQIRAIQAAAASQTGSTISALESLAQSVAAAGSSVGQFGTALTTLFRNSYPNNSNPVITPSPPPPKPKPFPVHTPCGIRRIQRAAP